MVNKRLWLVPVFSVTWKWGAMVDWPEEQISNFLLVHLGLPRLIVFVLISNMIGQISHAGNPQRAFSPCPPARFLYSTETHQKNWVLSEPPLPEWGSEGVGPFCLRLPQASSWGSSVTVTLFLVCLMKKDEKCWKSCKDITPGTWDKIITFSTIVLAFELKLKFQGRGRNWMVGVRGEEKETKKEKERERE